MTFPTSAAVRPTASAIARMPELAGGRGSVARDDGDGAVRVIWHFGSYSLTCWMKPGDLEMAT